MKVLTTLFLALVFCSMSVQAETVRKFEATAYCLKGITRSGRTVGPGVVAVDPRIIPLGSIVEILSPSIVSGTYIAADTGKVIKGSIIDIWLPTYRDAINFGRRQITVRIVPRNATSTYQELVKRVGMKYVRGGTGKSGYDCSGLVWSVFGSSGGFPRLRARDMWFRFPKPEPSTPVFGTLVFFNKLKHVGIMRDADTFFHASVSKGVTISKMTPYWRSRLVGFRALPQQCEQKNTLTF